MPRKRHHPGQLNLLTPPDRSFTEFETSALRRCITPVDRTYHSHDKPILAKALRGLSAKKLIRITFDDGNVVIAQGPPNASL